jgi:hypothetical protein
LRQVSGGEAPANFRSERRSGGAGAARAVAAPAADHQRTVLGPAGRHRPQVVGGQIHGGVWLLLTPAGAPVAVGGAPRLDHLTPALGLAVGVLVGSAGGLDPLPLPFVVGQREPWMWRPQSRQGRRGIGLVSPGFGGAAQAG